MPSDAVSGPLPVNPVQSIQAPKPILLTTGGSFLPAGGNGPPLPAPQAGALLRQDVAVAAPAARTAAIPATRPATATNQSKLPALLAQLNKYLNDSGRPNQFRVDPGSNGRTIQELNPANGEVVGEFSAIEFPELARSLGVSGVLVDSLA